jgi:hypothetical protein
MAVSCAVTTRAYLQGPQLPRRSRDYPRSLFGTAFSNAFEGSSEFQKTIQKASRAKYD